MKRRQRKGISRQRILRTTWPSVVGASSSCDMPWPFGLGVGNLYADRVEHGPGLDEGLVVLGRGGGVGDDAAADGDVREAVLEDHCADGDVEVESAVRADGADRAAVGAAAGGLEFVDDLHGADLWGAGD